MIQCLPACAWLRIVGIIHSLDSNSHVKVTNSSLKFFPQSAHVLQLSDFQMSTAEMLYNGDVST